MKELLEFIAKSMVDNPGAVVVNAKDTEHSCVLELSVGEGDMGKVIGKQGRIAKAIRVVVSAASARENKKYYVEIL